MHTVYRNVCTEHPFASTACYRIHHMWYQPEGGCRTVRSHRDTFTTKPKCVISYT